MKRSITSWVLLLSAAIFLAYFVGITLHKQEAKYPEPFTVYSENHAPVTLNQVFGSQIQAAVEYSLCFHYATTGLSLPNLQISDANISQPSISFNLPRNSWGLGNVCLSITPKSNYKNPKLVLTDNGNNSSLSISSLTLDKDSRFAPDFLKRPLQNDSGAEIKLQSNYATLQFVMPLVIFVLLWLGSGYIFSSRIIGLNRLEIWFVTPVMGMVILSFLAYLLSLAGLYNFPLLFSSVLLLSYAAYRPNRTLPAQSRRQVPVPLKFGRFFEICAAMLIAFTAFKFIDVAATPFYFNDWDGIVSWNKWGADWALREMRGNYQFTYPQMLPLLYSIYYKLAGYSALDPLTLSMNSVHFLNTFLGLLSLPLVYVCSKALNVNPIIPVICVLSFRYLGMVNAGFVDTMLVTYNLACALVVLRGSQMSGLQTDIASFISICLLGAGAIFLKQIGIFASIAVLAFLFIHYRGLFTSIRGLFWIALSAVVPVEFYLHEAFLDAYPALADHNPLNHSIGGVISNAGAQTDIVSSLSWYAMLSGKILWAIGGPWLSKWTVMDKAGTLISLLVGLGLIAFYCYASYKLYRQKNWPWLILWVSIVGGQLVIGALFGYRYDVRYIYTFIPALGFMIAIAVHRAWKVRQQKVLVWLFPIATLAFVYTLFGFHPKQPPFPGNGYDMISYEARLKRFFAPDFVKVEEHLVAQSGRNFKFSTDSTFVTWPNTIYAGRKYEAVFQPGDYFYTVTQKKCPLQYAEIMVTDSSINTIGRLCQKTEEASR